MVFSLPVRGFVKTHRQIIVHGYRFIHAHMYIYRVTYAIDLTY